MLKAILIAGGLCLVSIGGATNAAGDGGAPPAGASAGSASFPRLMGMNIGAKNYESAAYQAAMARLDVVILGFYRGWQNGYAATPALAMRKAVQALKAINPKILVGQYTILTSALDDPNDVASLDIRTKLYTANWWLLNAAKRKVQYTREFGPTWEVNVSTWAPQDADGKRWPAWIAERNYEVFFRDIPELDIMFVDNVQNPRVAADWNLDGVDEPLNSPSVLAANYAGHVAEWIRVRQLLPKVLLVGNTDNDLGNPEWKGQLDGGLLEGIMGESWSIESREGWSAAMARYRAVMRNTRSPKIVGFNVHGNPGDYRFFRYAYASCLLDDGYFSFNDKAVMYSSVPWFDEYDFKLGRALSGPPAAAWNQGVWRRDFQNGVVLVNPTTVSRTVAVEPGLRRLAGTQNPSVNDGAVVRQVTLRSKDGIVLRR
jgi:putative glycosyl hydrolase-like family 15 (GHL15) protein